MHYAQTYTLSEKELIINNLVAKAETSLPVESNLSENDVEHLLKKKNIFERLQEVEKVNVEKDEKIEMLTVKLEKFECEMKKQYLEAFEIMSELVAECEDNEKFDELTSFSCPECDFVGKHLRGLRIHMTKKHLKLKPIG